MNRRPTVKLIARDHGVSEKLKEFPVFSIGLSVVLVDREGRGNTGGRVGRNDFDLILVILDG